VEFVVQAASVYKMSMVCEKTTKSLRVADGFAFFVFSPERGCGCVAVVALCAACERELIHE
jgi:hypothetical protein